MTSGTACALAGMTEPPKPVVEMTRLRFRNALCVLTSIDRHELVGFQVLDADDGLGWHQFRTDPYRWFIRADDTSAERLWALMLTRMR